MEPHPNMAKPFHPLVEPFSLGQAEE